MSDQSDKERTPDPAFNATEQTPPVESPGPLNDWLRRAMWLTVLVCVAALAWSQIRRMQVGARGQLWWVPIAQDDAAPRAANSLDSAGDRTLSETAEDSHAPSDELAALAAQLDDPSLGRFETDPDRDALEAGVPISKRWRVILPPGLTEGQYARHLSALKIELGILDGAGRVSYVTHPGEATMSRRTGKRAEEDRLYWTWDGGNLDRADGLLMTKAGLEASGNIVLHFCPKETIKMLAELEKKYKNRAPAKILLTRFSIKRTFRGYEVFVMDQVARP